MDSQNEGVEHCPGQQLMKQKIFEAAMEVSAANGVLRVAIFRGSDPTKIDKEFQESVKALCKLLDEAFPAAGELNSL